MKVLGWCLAWVACIIPALVAVAITDDQWVWWVGMGWFLIAWCIFALIYK